MNVQGCFVEVGANRFDTLWEYELRHIVLDIYAEIIYNGRHTGRFMIQFVWHMVYEYHTRGLCFQMICLRV